MNERTSFFFFERRIEQFYGLVIINKKMLKTPLAAVQQHHMK
jgi:hypothetical protein